MLSPSQTEALRQVFSDRRHKLNITKDISYTRRLLRSQLIDVEDAVFAVVLKEDD